MNLKKTGKIITVMAATVALISSIVIDKKSKNTNEKNSIN